MPGHKTAFVSALTEVTTVAKDQLGDIRWVGNKCYKYVQYDEATAAVDGVAGEVAYYIIDTGYGANVVTSDLSDGGGAGAVIAAGVLQGAMSQDEYGWIQIKGLAVLTIALTAGADGNALTPQGSADGTLDVVVTTVALGHICAYIVDVTAKEILCDFPF